VREPLVKIACTSDLTAPSPNPRLDVSSSLGLGAGELLKNVFLVLIEGFRSLRSLHTLAMVFRPTG